MNPTVEKLEALLVRVQTNRVKPRAHPQTDVMTKAMPAIEAPKPAPVAMPKPVQAALLEAPTKVTPTPPLEAPTKLVQAPPFEAAKPIAAAPIAAPPVAAPIAAAPVAAPIAPAPVAARSAVEAPKPVRAPVHPQLEEEDYVPTLQRVPSPVSAPMAEPGVVVDEVAEPAGPIGIVARVASPKAPVVKTATPAEAAKPKTFGELLTRTLSLRTR